MALTGPAVFPSQPVTTTFAGSYPGTQAVPGASEFSGDTITPADNLYPGSGTFGGQGNAPIIRIRLSFDDVSVASPVWSDATTKLRAFSTNRGRESELVAFDAGTAEVTLDNRDRSYDQTLHPTVRPLNRIWLYEEFVGEVHDLFRGYAESWNQQWPDGGWSDAVVEVPVVDEFKVLALDALPTTSPVRSSYEDLVSSDNPSAYWRLNDDPVVQVQTATEPEPNPVATDPGSVPDSGGLFSGRTSGGFFLF